MIKSTVAFKSNIQPLQREVILDDRDFLRHIHDPFALEKLKKNGRYSLTDIQEKEYSRVALHCVYAYKDDYPWGTIHDAQNKKRVVCKCTNTQCKLFSGCRPDFSEEELRVYDENILFQAQNSITYIPLQSEQDIEETDETVTVSVEREHEIQENVSEPGSEKSNDDISAPDTTSESREVTENDNKEKKLREDAQKEARSIKKKDKTSLQEDEGSERDFSSFVNAEQADIISLPCDERTIVNAGPGTGKTYTLIEKIKYIIDNTDISAEEIMVLCFSKSAVKVIQERLERAGDRGEIGPEWNLVDIRTFDSFATYLLAWANDNERDKLPDYFRLDILTYDQRIEYALDFLKKAEDVFDTYRHVIIDEVQDLVGNRAKMVLEILKSLPDECGFTLLGDSCQSLYDYIAIHDPRAMISSGFYNELFNHFKKANLFTLTENHRQDNHLADIAIPYREAIISGNSNETRKAAKSVLENVMDAKLDIYHPSKKDIDKYVKKGSLGILTRTNGQALQISSWLRNENISHSLKQPAGRESLDGWIYDVLSMTKSKILDKESVIHILTDKKHTDGLTAEKCWDALQATLGNNQRDKIEQEDLVSGLLKNGKAPYLSEQIEKNNASFVISNIHRAKGSEYDSVIVLEDVISSVTEENDEDELEHKVCYVAVTRPKKQIEKIAFKKEADKYIYIQKNAGRRCFKRSGRAGRFFLSQFEVGLEKDFDTRELGRDKKTQDYIRNMKIGDRLRLKRVSKREDTTAKYVLVPEENESIQLCHTTKEFSDEIILAVRRIFDNYGGSMKGKYFPECFTDIYVDGFTTEVSLNSKGMDGATKFSSGLCFWKGLRIIGFAHGERESY